MNDLELVKNYYEPIKSRFTPLLKNIKNLEAAKVLIENCKQEISIYESYKEYFSY